MKTLNSHEIEAITRHLGGILTILGSPEEELDICLVDLEKELNIPVPPTVCWNDICGKWSFNQEAYEELTDKIPSPFTIFKEDDRYFITFDKKRELIYRLEELSEKDGLFYFFIDSCYFKLTYNPDLKGIYIIPYFNYFQRKED